jgi:hypothetical protein
MNSYVIIGIATMLTLVSVAAMTTTTVAYATTNPNTDEPNRWGQTTSGAAEEDGQTNLGEHSSDPDPNAEVGVSGRETPRSGLGNVGESLPEPFTTDSKHPSELAESLCQIDPDAAGC